LFTALTVKITFLIFPTIPVRHHKEWAIIAADVFYRSYVDVEPAGH
jgi:hypothetical protein